MGTKLLERIDKINAEKRTKALRMIDALKDYPEIEFHRVDSLRHNYHLLEARIGGGLRNGFIRMMANEFGIQCVVQYYPLNRYPLYRKLGFGRADCPVADDFFDNMVSFPFNHLLTDDELAYIIDSAKTVMDRLRN